MKLDVIKSTWHKNIPFAAKAYSCLEYLFTSVYIQSSNNKENEKERTKTIWRNINNELKLKSLIKQIE